MESRESCVRSKAGRSLGNEASAVQRAICYLSILSLSFSEPYAAQLYTMHLPRQSRPCNVCRGTTRCKEESTCLEAGCGLGSDESRKWAAHDLEIGDNSTTVVRRAYSLQKPHVVASDTARLAPSSPTPLSHRSLVPTVCCGKPQALPLGAPPPLLHSAAPAPSYKQTCNRNTRLIP